MPLLANAARGHRTIRPLLTTPLAVISSKSLQFYSPKEYLTVDNCLLLSEAGAPFANICHLKKTNMASKSGGPLIRNRLTLCKVSCPLAKLVTLTALVVMVLIGRFFVETATIPAKTNLLTSSWLPMFGKMVLQLSEFFAETSRSSLLNILLTVFEKNNVTQIQHFGFVCAIEGSNCSYLVQHAPYT